MDPERPAPDARGLLLALDDALETVDADRQHRLALVGLSVASLAHELRNRLSVIRGFADLARRGPPERARELAAEIERVSIAAADRLEAYLDLASGRALPLVDLSTLVEDVVHLVRPLGVLREVLVTGELKSEQRRELDPTGLRPALLDLLLNAIDHAAKSVVATLTDTDDGHALTIDDDGPGLPEGWKAEEFRAFTSVRPGGTGLGLLSALKLVAQAGGAVTTSRSPLGGARFTVSLPRRST